MNLSPTDFREFRAFRVRKKRDIREICVNPCDLWETKSRKAPFVRLASPNVVSCSKEKDLREEFDIFNRITNHAHSWKKIQGSSVKSDISREKMSKNIEFSFLPPPIR